VYVNVHVFVPEHTGSAPGTPADGTIGRPQLSETDGGVGATASARHATVDEPPAGRVTVGALIVYVKTQSNVEPSQVVYVNVHVFVPAHNGSADGTPAEGVSVVPQLSTTGGGTGIVASDGHATVAAPGAGIDAKGGRIVYVYTHG
jgi:hypothetical protein